uniref:Type I-A CRISPR-associated protein Csa5 n=1 Tax=Geoglobus ahangari TaxID=113653 RepID=A0A7J3TJX4_9EURY
MGKDIENLARVLAVLVADGNYTYVDKIGNAPSKDLLAFYLKEAIRDFHSLIRGGAKNEKVKDLLDRIVRELETTRDPFDFLNNSIDQVFSKIESRKDLREISSLISAKALAISAKYVRTREESSEGGE